MLFVEQLLHVFINKQRKKVAPPLILPPHLSSHQLHFRLDLASSCAMRILFAFALTLFSAFGSTAAKGPAKTLEDFRSKFNASPPLKLDDNSYNTLTATPRNHTLVVLLTALEARFGCQLCKDFQPEWEILALSATKTSSLPENPSIYGTLDFVDGKATFQTVHPFLRTPDVY